MRESFYNMGYREGILRGEEEHLEAYYNVSFGEASRIGCLLGTLEGMEKAHALFNVSCDLPEARDPSEWRRSYLEDGVKPPPRLDPDLLQGLVKDPSLLTTYLKRRDSSETSVVVEEEKS